MDIDKYLFVPKTKNHNETLSTAASVYQDHLENLLNKHSKSSGSKTSGLQFQNTFYGDTNASQFKWENADGTACDILLCRFVHRHKPTPRSHTWYRQKFFARVDTALYANVHNINWMVYSEKRQKYNIGLTNVVALDPETELCHNHFKLNWEEEATILDTQFRDSFCPLMEDALHCGKE